MSSLISGNNAKSEYNSGYSGSSRRVTKSSAGVVVVPKKKKTAVRGKVSIKKARRAAAASKSALKKKIITDKRIRYAFIAVLAACAALLSFAIIVYCTRISYFSEHFYDNTVINGADVSGMTLAETEALMQTMVDDYTLTVTDFEGRTYYAGAGVFGLTYEDDGTLAGILESQSPFLWPFKKGVTEDYDIASSLHVNRNALDAWVASLDCSGEAVMPSDAYLTTDEDGFWYIVPEVYGNTVDQEKMGDILENAIRTCNPYINMTDSGTYCYYAPSVYSTDEGLHEQMIMKNEEVKAQKELEAKIRELTDVNIILDGQYENYTLGPEQLASWIIYDTDGQPSLDTSPVLDWVNGFAQANGLVGSNSLFRTHDGYIVTVDQGPYGGWSMDINATAEQVKNALRTKTSGTISPVMVSADGISQSADSYIEISLSDQMMWFYQNGNVLVETPIVSGNVIADYETPSYGVWAVDYKATSYHMMGPLLEDGVTRAYETTVNYWIPFNNDIGIHDLSSRDEFGGEIYVRDGSHGCINTPLEAVAQLYDLVEPGTKVVVYGS